ncbi:DinB family protein [Dactylosporangium cerinum]
MTLPPLPEEDHHCESCGLRYGDLTTAAALGLIRSYPTRYRRRLQHLPVDVLRRRPTSGVWSALEYACHVRDVYDVYDTRVRRTLTEHEPTLEPMRNDERAEQRAYNQQSLAAVLLDLERNVDRFAALTSEISEPQWSRSAVRLLENAAPSCGWFGRPRTKGCITSTTSARAQPTRQCCSTSTACSSIRTPHTAGSGADGQTTATSIRTWSGHTLTAAGPSTPFR